MYRVCFSALLFTMLFLSAFNTNAQDFGTIGGENEETVEDEPTEYSDAYRLTIRVRPLSYLLFPVTSGNLGSFNARVDYAFNRQFGFGVEMNYFYNDIWPAANLFATSDLLALRIDANYYILKKSNMDRYCEGFHLGPYMKYRSEESSGPDIQAAYGTNRVYGTALIFGGLIGFQSVKNRFVIDQHIGVGAGIGSYNVTTSPVLDFRLGLSIGMVVLK